jgi:Holliday junction DNA helicase RuvA
MFDYIKGTIANIKTNAIVVDCNGVGYLIYVSNPYAFEIGKTYKVYVYQQIQEDEHLLYGFKLQEEKDLFLKLISVTGIGPKSALPIMAASSVSDIIGAISSGNVSYMQKFPGIGPKAAQQIILDLRGKVDFAPATLIDDTINDCIEALVALGYNRKEVNKVIAKVDQSLAQNQIIKEALKLLSKL